MSTRLQYVVSLARRDRACLRDIRAAVSRALEQRSELRDSHVMIWAKPALKRKAPQVTVVRGPRSDAVRILMNVVADVTGNSVAGELVDVR